MRRTFCYYFFFFLYLEIVLHWACYQSVSFSFLLMAFLFTIPFAILFGMLCSFFKKERINGILFKVITTFFIILYLSEMIYYQIYNSFFSYQGLLFLSAVKDGFDKVFQTIVENIGFVILFLLPLGFIYSKHTKYLKRLESLECFAFACFFILFQLFPTFIISYSDKDDFYSMYHLYYHLNVPLFNVENFGFLTSTRMSLQRELFGFQEQVPESEDILNNDSTSLLSSTKVEFNKSSIDFSKVSAPNDTIQQLHDYFGSVKPTSKNQYTGYFKDKNVILIVAESLDMVAVDSTLTPTLYRMTSEGMLFENYFSPTYPAGTADGEYMIEWGLLPIIGNNYSLIDMVYNEAPYILPNVFKELGYKTYAYHNYYGYYNYRNQYFAHLPWDEYKFGDRGMNLYMEKYHASDVDLMVQSVPDYKDEERFFAYYITLSGHGSYDTGSNYIVKKNWNLVSGTNYSANLKGYLAANIELDRGLAHLIQELEKSGALDDTVIAVTSDHTPYYLTGDQLNQKSSIDRNDKFDRNRGIFFIWNSEMKTGTKVEKYAMNIDVLPTLLNLIGYPYDSRLLMGKDILSNSEGLAILSDRSWINEYGRYDTSRQKFYPASDKVVGEQYVAMKNQEVAKMFQISSTMQYQDYYQYLF